MLNKQYYPYPLPSCEVETTEDTKGRTVFERPEHKGHKNSLLVKSNVLSIRDLNESRSLVNIDSKNRTQQSPCITWPQLPTWTPIRRSLYDSSGSAVSPSSRSWWWLSDSTVDRCTKAHDTSGLLEEFGLAWHNIQISASRGTVIDGSRLFPIPITDFCGFFNPWNASTSFLEDSLTLKWKYFNELVIMLQANGINTIAQRISFIYAIVMFFNI